VRIAVIVLGLCGAAVATADGLLWFDGARPSTQAHQAVEWLVAAESHGLVPADYDAGTLQQALTRATQGPAPAPEQIARLEQALTAAMQRYLSDLHGGRIDPQQIGQRFASPRRDEFDAAATLRAALAARRLFESEREVRPQLPLYEALRTVLAHYRARVGHPAWHQPLPPLPGARRGTVGKLEPGQDYAGLAGLTERLRAVGDLAPDGPAPIRYEAPLTDAVAAFQRRHGLNPDQVIGPQTLAQLQVTPAARVRQIELALERLRWTPLMQAPRMVVINIPEFVLRAYEVRDGGIEVIEKMKVIVGKAVDTRTPVFAEDMRYIEFGPYWNVPASIARAEIVPKVRQAPGYFAQQGFEFVARDGKVSNTLSAAQLDAVLAGQLRIRQRPGPQNALGDIKFVFPNSDSIYLHDTPSTRLFGHDRRDFSHGCIRVEEPVALAKFVLQDMPEWTEERIRDAMGRGRSATLRLATPVRVLITYITTVVKDGRVHFFEDIYGQDKRLDAALQRRAQARRSLFAPP
jgi:L,D-transpeptidase YcbB